jgi:phosphoketolase
MHVEMARTLDAVLLSIRDFQAAARTGGSRSRPAWPMIVLATPKGWIGPATVDAADRRDVSRPPDSSHRPAHQSRAPATARGVDAQLSP